MIRAIMHGCNGRMGQFITGIAAGDEKIEIVDFKLKQEKEEIAKEELEIELYKTMIKADRKGKELIIRVSDEEKKNIFEEMENQNLIKIIAIPDNEKEENTKTIIKIEVEPDKVKEKLNVLEKAYKEKQDRRLVTPYEEI